MNKQGGLRLVGSSGDAYGRAGMLPSNGRGIRNDLRWRVTVMGTSCMCGYLRCSGSVEGVDALLA